MGAFIPEAGDARGAAGVEEPVDERGEREWLRGGSALLLGGWRDEEGECRACEGSHVPEGADPDRAWQSGEDVEGCDRALAQREDHHDQPDGMRRVETHLGDHAAVIEVVLRRGRRIATN